MEQLRELVLPLFDEVRRTVAFRKPHVVVECQIRGRQRPLDSGQSNGSFLQP